MYLEGGKIFHSKKLDLLLKVWFARKLMSKISKNATISGGSLSFHLITYKLC
jgi:hypothetical protein